MDDRSGPGRARTGARWARLPRPVRLVAVEVALLTATALEVLPFGLPGDPLLDLSVLALLLALPVRLVAPEVAVLLAAVGTRWAFSLVAPAVVVARLAYRRSSSRWVLLWCGLGTAVAVAPFWATGPGAAQVNLTSVATAAAIYGGGAAIGRLRRSRREQRAAYARLERSLEVQRRLAADTARAEERAAMAREMHDVVSHHISLIALQAGALRAAPAPAEVVVTTAETIRKLSVQANTELRHLLSALRDDAGTGAAGTCHGLDDLECLVATAGLPAHLLVEGDTAAVPPTVQAACYRVVQEGLANAGKHAPGAPVEVCCRVAGGLVTCTVTNASPGRSPAPGLPGGLGLLGLRERVGLLDGHLTAAGRPDGGWCLQVVLPLADVRTGPADGVLPG